MENEVWKDVSGYEGYYQVSNLGRVKSLKSKSNIKILKPFNYRGYFRLGLYMHGNYKAFYVHKLVAMSFLNHVPCGYDVVVDHIDGNPSNNNVTNLQLTSQRNNVIKSNKKQTKNSRYIGVFKQGNNKKWTARISVKYKTLYLGSFNTEEEASIAYLNALNKINNNDFRFVNEKISFTSKYKGVNWDRLQGKWRVQITTNGKQKYIGMYSDEIEAHKAYQNELIKAPT